MTEHLCARDVQGARDGKQDFTLLKLTGKRGNLRSEQTIQRVESAWALQASTWGDFLGWGGGALWYGAWGKPPEI